MNVRIFYSRFSGSSNEIGEDPLERAERLDRACLAKGSASARGLDTHERSVTGFDLNEPSRR